GGKRGPLVAVAGGGVGAAGAGPRGPAPAVGRARGVVAPGAPVRRPRRRGRRRWRRLREGEEACAVGPGPDGAGTGGALGGKTLALVPAGGKISRRSRSRRPRRRPSGKDRMNPPGRGSA